MEKAFSNFPNSEDIGSMSFNTIEFLFSYIILHFLLLSFSVSFRPSSTELSAKRSESWKPLSKNFLASLCVRLTLIRFFDQLHWNGRLFPFGVVSYNVFKDVKYVSELSCLFITRR